MTTTTFIMPNGERVRRTGFAWRHIIPRDLVTLLDAKGNRVAYLVTEVVTDAIDGEWRAVVRLRDVPHSEVRYLDLDFYRNHGTDDSPL
jgi:hypothetical protein